MDLSYVFAPTGLLAEHIPNYGARPQQEVMARAVTKALDQQHKLIVEAGTGTGKTFAYLVPALLSGRRIIISTGTKTLQDQLFKKDLPTVAKALGLPVKVALLKGRSNYLCLHRMHLQEIQGRFSSKKEAREFASIVDWSVTTRAGDTVEVANVSEQSGVWPKVTSTVENCLGSDCSEYQKCFVVKARRKAQEADIVVVNHHLLLADFAIRDEGFGELLPDANGIIVDEAHQLAEIASNFFGTNASSRQLQSLCRDIKAESLKIADGFEVLEKEANNLEKHVLDARLEMPRVERLAWDQLGRNVVDTLLQTLTALEKALEALRQFAGHTTGLDHCCKRLQATVERWSILLDQDDVSGLRWLDVTKTGFVMHLTPFEVASNFRQFFAANPGSWIMTSATLAVEEDFSHFADRIGADDASTLKLDSPFDYQKNALLHLPDGLPEPNQPEFVSRMLTHVLPFIQAAGGRTFLLFTSYRALNEAARLLAQKLDFPLLIQGNAPRDELLQSFRESGNAVLLGTSSFWEGVDVRGSALVLVVIDKLPFASPGDPVLQARLEAIRRDGGQPFRDYQLPQAVISLKQGVGRLIRDFTDQGVVVLCDKRIRSKGYGKTFLNSLPPMRVSNQPREVERFLSNLDGTP